MSTPPNPLLIPTLTNVVAEGIPALLIAPESSLSTINTVIDPHILAEQIIQVIAPQIEEIVKNAILKAIQTKVNQKN